MLVERHASLDLFALVPQLQLRCAPELAELDRLLEDDALFELVKADLARRRPRSLVTGRPSTPVEVILRLLVIKHRYQWSDEDTERFVGDSLVRRQFCRLALEPVPDHTTLLRWANLLQPETRHRLLDRVVELARSLTVTRGRTLRLDSTVVETDSHHPSDSTLRADGVRVLSRMVRRAKAAVATVGGGTATRAPDLRGLPDVWRDRTRSAKWRARRIGESLARRLRRAEREHVRGPVAPGGEEERRGLSRRLLTVARASVRQATRVEEALASVPMSGAAARLRAAFSGFLPLVERVICQTERRVLRGERVPAAEKVLSLFEPHTAILRRGKARQPTEFGAKVVLDEVAGGLVTRDAVCGGNPDDAHSVPPALAHHQRCFGRVPHLLAGDRHCFSFENERLATAAGIIRVVLPKRGLYGARDAARRQRERARWFRRGHRFRSGIEGRISVRRRRFGLRRCRSRGAAGAAGMERWVGWGILAHDLRAIARALARRAH